MASDSATSPAKEPQPSASPSLLSIVAQVAAEARAPRPLLAGVAALQRSRFNPALPSTVVTRRYAMIEMLAATSDSSKSYHLQLLAQIIQGVSSGPVARSPIAVLDAVMRCDERPRPYLSLIAHLAADARRQKETPSSALETVAHCDGAEHPFLQLLLSAQEVKSNGEKAAAASPASVVSKSAPPQQRRKQSTTNATGAKSERTPTALEYMLSCSNAEKPYLNLLVTTIKENDPELRAKKPKRVRIVVRGALNVPPPSWVGMKEPYCTIHLGKQVFRTAIAKDPEHPEWNETVVFTLDDVETAAVTVRLWEDDFDATKIGKGTFTVKDLFRGAWTNMEVPLLGGTAGNISVRFGLFAINFGPRPKLPDADTTATSHASDPHSPKKAAFEPKRTPENDPLGFTENLHKRINDLRAEAMNSNGAVDQTNDYAAIINSAMELEKHTCVNDAVSVLSHVIRVSHFPDISSLALNNLACVETRRGNPDIALHHLERAADIEGGMEVAQPTTLTNLAVAFTALKRYAEAAAIANHAVKLCDATSDCRPAVKCSALYNFGVALEQAGEVKQAAQVFERAASILPSGHPFRATLLSQAEQARSSIAALESEQKWKAANRVSLIKSSADRLRNMKGLPPPKSVTPQPTRETPALARKLAPLESSLKAAALQDTTMGIYAHSQKPQRLQRLINRSDMSSLALIAADATSPERKGNRSASKMRSAAATPPPPAEPPKPVWNNDPFPTGHPMSHRKVIPSKMSHELERRINDRFIPRKVLPLLVDLQYKENTRRAAISAEWKKQMHSMKSLMQLHRVLSMEDETRAGLLSDENRGRRVLQNWIRGRLVFARGCLATEGAEAKDRETMSAEQQKEASTVLASRANEVRLMTAEELNRRAMETERRDALATFKIRSEALIAELSATDMFKDSYGGVADALTTWTLESVFAQWQALELMPQSMKDSLFVKERYSMFGHPASFQLAAPKKRVPNAGAA